MRRRPAGQDRAAGELAGGVEIYEGLVTNGTTQADLDTVDAALDRVRALVVALAEEDLSDTDTVIVTGGGSAYFDRVVAVLGNWDALGRSAQLILRSGCYLTHDMGKYARVSPLDGRRDATEPMHLRNALEGWARVLSTPEPQLAILGTGKHDLPYDVEPPRPLLARQHDGSTTDASTVFGDGDLRSSLPRFTAEARRANQALVEPLGTIAQGKGVTPAQIALAWLLAQKPWIVPIPGTRRVERLEENLGAAETALTSDELVQIERAAGAVQVYGARHPEHLQLIDR